MATMFIPPSRLLNLLLNNNQDTNWEKETAEWLQPITAGPCWNAASGYNVFEAPEAKWLNA